MVSPVAADLLERWTGLVGAGAEAVGRDLLTRWSEPHRAYHDAAHLRAVLDAVDLLAGHAVDPAAVRLAAWFHDAVYEGEAGADEEASAVLAERVLPSVGVPRDRVAEVARLVRLTAGHDPEPGDADGAVLCDADLAVLGSDPEDYAAYVAAVRRDYAAVPDEAFRAGRAAVLERLLGLDPLYRTATARRLWADRAAANLSAELDRLRGGASGGEGRPR
jgi:predicted metal-dependent HD superfamily phosphohydrolase